MVVEQPHGDRERVVLIAQLGLITRTQALECGNTPGMIKAKLHRGEWVQIQRGIYRATLFPETHEQLALAHCLRAPGRAWASHRTAAWLHDLGPGPDNEISITATSRLRQELGTTAHYVPHLPACDHTVRRGIPVTAIERTLLDYASVASLDEIEFALDEAIVTRRTSLRKLEWRLSRFGGRGIPGTATLQKCLRARRRVGQVEKQLERQFFAMLEEGRIPRPRMQHPIRLPTRTVFADFAYPEHRLIVEVYGYRYHGGRERWESDLLRSSDLGAIGWRMMYVTKEQMRSQARRRTIDRLRRHPGWSHYSNFDTRWSLNDQSVTQNASGP